MIEIPDGMSDEEFGEFYWSKTDAERIEINRVLARQARENGFLTEEEYAEREAKIDRHAKIIEDLKHVEELARRNKIAQKLVEDRLNARLADMMKTESPTFFDDVKNTKTH